MKDFFSDLGISPWDVFKLNLFFLVALRAFFQARSQVVKYLFTVLFLILLVAIIFSQVSINTKILGGVLMTSLLIIEFITFRKRRGLRR